MLVIIAFCAKDKPIAERLASWIAELGGVKKHDCLLAVHIDTKSTGVIETLQGCFGRVAEFSVDDTETIYPFIANMMWKRSAQHVADMNESMPWLWLEPDAVPIVPEWLDRIEEEYKTCGKPFMLDQVITPNSVHNSGVGVYPAKVRDYTMNLWNLANIPWDVFFKEDFTPKTHHTELIHDKFYKVWDDPTSGAPVFPDAESLSIIESKAVLFHRNKDGSLIQRLREARGGVVAARASHSSEVLGSIPSPETTKVFITNPGPATVVARSLAESIRFHCAELAGLVEDKPSRKQQLHAELRKVKLLGSAKTRMKSK